MKHVLLGLVTLIALTWAALAASAGGVTRVQLAVPIRLGAAEDSGPTSLAMVLEYYGADSVTLRRTREAIDPVSKGATLESLQAVAERLGYSARIAQPGLDSLLILLREGVPPILSIDPARGSTLRQRFFVVTAGDPRSPRFQTLDGRPKPKQLFEGVLIQLWNPAEGRALIVTRRGK